MGYDNPLHNLDSNGNFVNAGSTLPGRRVPNRSRNAWAMHPSFQQYRSTMAVAAMAEDEGPASDDDRAGYLHDSYQPFEPQPPTAHPLAYDGLTDGCLRGPSTHTHLLIVHHTYERNNHQQAHRVSIELTTYFTGMPLGTDFIDYGTSAGMHIPEESAIELYHRLGQRLREFGLVDAAGNQVRPHRPL